MQNILFYIFYALIWTITWLPLSILFLISSLMYPLVYYVFRYRRKVVRKNLTNSFPEKSHKEILTIERRFYQYFCDFFIETIKLLHISEKEMSNRMKFSNMELFDRFYKEGKSAILYIGHYGNWEWLSFAGKQNEDKNKGFKSRPIYYALKDKNFDKLFFNFRSIFGNEPVESKKILRTIIRLQKKGQQSVFTFLADQTPNRANIHHWMTFLNQETPVITGTERIAKQTSYPVVYFDVKRIKRGYYTADTILISDDASNMTDFELTEKYMQLMEKTILRDPANWLWTHKRWKHERFI